MAYVKLSDGTFAQIPDGLPEDAAQNFISRIEAANKADKQTTPGGIIDPFADPNAPTLAQTATAYAKTADAATGGALSSAADKASAADNYLGNWPSATGKMAAHVGADIALGVPSAFAGAANALSHVAQKYGLAGPSPDLPIPSQSVPAALGVPPETSPGGQATEALLALAAGNKLQGAEKVWSLAGVPSALVKAPFQYGAQWLGSNVGGAVAGAVDPRLRETGEFVGGVAPLATSPEAIASKGIDWLPAPVRDAIRAPNASRCLRRHARRWGRHRQPEPHTHGRHGRRPDHQGSRKKRDVFSRRQYPGAECASPRRRRFGAGRKHSRPAARRAWNGHQYVARRSRGRMARRGPGSAHKCVADSPEQHRRG